MSDLKAKAHGRWAHILPALGIEKRFLVNRGGPCPICQEGKDRFRFDDQGDGLWFCNRCGAGDGFSLIEKAKGLSFKDVAREVEKHVGTAPYVPPAPAVDPAKVRESMRALWASSMPIEQSAHLAAWWMARVGSVPSTSEIRGVRRLRYQDGRDGVPSLHPGMLARLRSPDGRTVNLHRTYLTECGGKASVPQPRKIMPLDIPPGSAVRLAPYTDTLGIAEGIETAIAASLMFGIPCWAALNTSLLKTWQPPADVAVVIFADNDPPDTRGHKPGTEAARALAGRLLDEGREVTIRTPATVGDDWNDELIRRLALAASNIAIGLPERSAA